MDTLKGKRAGGWGSILSGLLCCMTAAGAEPPASPDTISAGYRRSHFRGRSADGQSRNLTLLLWHPTGEQPRRFEYFLQAGWVAPDSKIIPGAHPLIVFSHGYLGAGDQVIYLMEALARAGYIVAAVNHADSRSERRSGPRPSPPKFADPGSWDDRKFRDRREDMTALLDYLLAQNREPTAFLHQHIREDAIGIAGHSLGGYTALGMVGAWPSWRDDRLKAALLLSPYAQPFLGRLNPSQVKIPVMLQGGTLDFGITPALSPIYDRLPAPKYFITLWQQTHFAWTNLLTLGRSTLDCLAEPGPVKLIANYSIAFFDRTLRGRDAPLLRKGDRLLESNRFLER